MRGLRVSGCRLRNDADRFDALVVGAGVVGVTAAMALQQRGLKVLILDQQPPGQGCSFEQCGRERPDRISP
ncbi:FAD-dependent oxidoreductase [Bradyrhizobium sp. CCBAU 51753]|uniref:FAD-dependent oxidoreductase n=1 Tax=Bradyrhizobium sp. CCBAU 51753 TaxID=1325100 RepID=UPI0018C00A61|nr:hypothetical protein XH93_09640 [Bradyrhizobium sp. CCBAU 51753]